MEPLEQETFAGLETVIEGNPTEAILKYFRFSHLPGHLQISAAYARVVIYLIAKLPRAAERTVALRKLLESKDAAVRAALD